jgi:ribosomal protein S18 acetylase RimI-like enzyme
LAADVMSNLQHTLREANFDDASALVVLASNAFRDTYRGLDDPKDIEDYIASSLTLSYFRSHIDNPVSRTFVVERTGELIGYAIVTRSPPPPCVTDVSAVELARLYLRNDVKGLGLGAELMRKAFSAARQFKATSMWLGVYDKNTRAREFYKRWGFVDVGTKDFLFGGKLYPDPVMACALPIDS